MRFMDKDVHWLWKTTPVDVFFFTLAGGSTQWEGSQSKKSKRTQDDQEIRWIKFPMDRVGVVGWGLCPDCELPDQQHPPKSVTQLRSVSRGIRIRLQSTRSELGPCHCSDCFQKMPARHCLLEIHKDDKRDSSPVPNSPTRNRSRVGGLRWKLSFA